jgi:hypothetical protein
VIKKKSRLKTDNNLYTVVAKQSKKGWQLKGERGGNTIIRRQIMVTQIESNRIEWMGVILYTVQLVDYMFLCSQN